MKSICRFLLQIILITILNEKNSPQPTTGSIIILLSNNLVAVVHAAQSWYNGIKHCRSSSSDQLLFSAIVLLLPWFRINIYQEYHSETLIIFITKVL